MKLRPDAALSMKQWLADRFRQPETIGYVAEGASDLALAGFLIGRVGDWESVPPVIEPRRIGVIDAVHVQDSFRRQGIATRLIERAVEQMRRANVVAVETVYDAWNDASASAWHRAGFAPWMVHAYRML